MSSNNWSIRIWKNQDALVRVSSRLPAPPGWPIDCTVRSSDISLRDPPQSWYQHLLVKFPKSYGQSGRAGASGAKFTSTQWFSSSISSVHLSYGLRWAMSVVQGSRRTALRTMRWMRTAWRSECGFSIIGVEKVAKLEVQANQASWFRKTFTARRIDESTSRHSFQRLCVRRWPPSWLRSLSISSKAFPVA